MLQLRTIVWIEIQYWSSVQFIETGDSDICLFVFCVYVYFLFVFNYFLMMLIRTEPLIDEDSEMGTLWGLLETKQKI